MARKRRVLTQAENRELSQAVLEAIPGSRERAIPRGEVLKKVEPHLKRKRIPARHALRHLAAHKKAGRVATSTRIGVWRPAPGDERGTPERLPPRRPKRTPIRARGTLQNPLRRIRKVTSFVCTRCFRPFPGRGEARAHLAAAHPLGAQDSRTMGAR